MNLLSLICGAALALAACQTDGARRDDAPAKQPSAGETSTFPIAFTPGPGQSLLVISVRGMFAAGERVAVRASPVGKPTAEQMNKVDAGTAQIGDERVKVLPADEV